MRHPPAQSSKLVVFETRAKNLVGDTQTIAAGLRHQHSSALEWIIILLIALEILVSSSTTGSAGSEWGSGIYP